MRNNARLTGVVLAVFGVWAWGSQAIAGSFVEHLSPPSLSRGKTNRVTLVGTELNGATGLWTSLSSKAVEATLVEPSGDHQAVFDVKVRPDAPLGLYGLRMASGSGLSNPKLFLIDDLPTVAERESNPGKEELQHLSWPVAVLGQA